MQTEESLRDKSYGQGHLMSTAQLAARLDMTRETIYRLIAAGEGPPRLRVGNKWLFPEDAFVRWCDDRLEPGRAIPKGET